MAKASLRAGCVVLERRNAECVTRKEERSEEQVALRSNASICSSPLPHNTTHHKNPKQGRAHFFLASLVVLLLYGRGHTPIGEFVGCPRSLWVRFLRAAGPLHVNIHCTRASSSFFPSILSLKKS